jgi:hypothetical protein
LITSKLLKAAINVYVRTLDDFKDPSEPFKVTEARYDYYLKKKKAKITVIRKILH